jgi:hypothetical protein
MHIPTTRHYGVTTFWDTRTPIPNPKTAPKPIGQCNHCPPSQEHFIADLTPVTTRAGLSKHSPTTDTVLCNRHYTVHLNSKEF